jgi:hypothetical protein
MEFLVANLVANMSLKSGQSLSKPSNQNDKKAKFEHMRVFLNNHVKKVRIPPPLQVKTLTI